MLPLEETSDKEFVFNRAEAMVAIRQAGGKRVTLQGLRWWVLPDGSKFRSLREYALSLVAVA